MAAGEHSLSSYSMGSLAILGCSEITQTFWMVETSHALHLGTQHSGAGRCQPPAFGVRWLQDVQSVRGAPSASPIKFAEALQCVQCIQVVVRGGFFMDITGKSGIYFEMG